MKFGTIVFWGCVIGALLDLLIASVAARIPQLAHASYLFLLSATCFTVGAVARYFHLPKGPKTTK